MSYDKRNIFAQILAGKIPCDKIYEDGDVLAFNDINPVAPVHIIVIPKGEYISFNDFALNAPPNIVTNFFQKLQIVAQKADVIESGYRIISNHGSDASQTVEHFHVHLIGGKALGGLIASDKLIR